MRLLTLTAPLLLVACATHDARIADRRTLYLGQNNTVISPGDNRPIDNVSYWDGDGVPGSPRIEINLTEQRAYFYKDSTLVGVSQLSTGREEYKTPAGNFKITQKSKDHRSNLYGDYVDAAGNVVMADIGVKTHPKPSGTTFRGASMPYFMRIHGGVGMHTGFLPGYPASHGCIRMPDFMARAFFNNVQINTPVTVRY